MWSMWNAPSDRDYYEQFARSEPEPDEDMDIRCCECGANYLQACEESCKGWQV